MNFDDSEQHRMSLDVQQLNLDDDLDDRLPDELADNEFRHESDLTTSILIGDDTTFEAELASTHDINKVDSSGATPLHYACFVGNTHYIDQLLEHGAHPDVKDHNRWTPLHRAVQKDNYEAVDRLLSSGANQWSTCKLQQTPLHVAATHNSVHSAKLLLQLSPEHLNKTDKQGSPALHHAAYYNNEQFVRTLLDYNADFTLRDKEGRSAAHWAAIGGHDKIMMMLMERGADLAARDKRGRTPLHYAAFTGKTAAIDCLLRYTEQPIDARDNDGFTPLHYATHTGNIRAIRMLADNSASIDIEAADGTSVAHIAAAHTESSHALDYYLALLPSSAKSAAVQKALNARRTGGFTPLHLACDQGRISRVDSLIVNGVDPNAKADGDIQPIHVAARAGHQMVIKHLLRDYGVDVNAQTRDGLTALHFSAYHSYVSTVRTLVDWEADVHRVDKKQRTPLHLAAVSTIEHNEFCVETLLGAGAEPSPKDIYGLTPLHYAASKSSNHVVEKLLRADASTEALDVKGRTPLHYAVWRARGPHPITPVIQALCRSNSSLLQRKDIDGLYPIHYAASRGNSSLVQFLFEGMGSLDLSSGAPLHLTPLHVAAAYDRFSVVRVLVNALQTQAAMVEQGACVLADKVALDTDTRMRIAMHYAMEKGYLECAKVLASASKRTIKKQLGWCDNKGQSPVHLAAANRHSHCVQWAMSVTDVLYGKDKMRRTPAMLAITAKLDTPTLNLLIEKTKTAEKQRDANGRGFLHRAAFIKSRPLVRSLLEAGCDPNDGDCNGVTPLHVAAAAGDKEVVQILIKAGARPHTVDKEGRLPADWAAAFGELATLETLAPPRPSTAPPLSPSSVRKCSRSRGEEEIGGEEETEGEGEEGGTEGEGDSLADQSTSTAGDLNESREEAGDEEVKEEKEEGEEGEKRVEAGKEEDKEEEKEEEKELDKSGSSGTVRSPNSRPASGMLSPSGIEMEFGASPPAASPAASLGTPPLITSTAVLLSAARGHVDCLTYLLALDMSLVHEVDKEGRTPLHLAALNARFDCVELLLCEGADIEAVDYLGRTPLMLAVTKPRASPVVEHLLDQGADISRADIDGNTAFHLVCTEKNEDAAKHLVNVLREVDTPEGRAAIANVQNNKGETALHLITKGGIVAYCLDFMPFATKSLWVKDNTERYPVTSAVQDRDVADVMHYLIAEMLSDPEKKTSSPPDSRKHSHSTQDGDEAFY